MKESLSLYQQLFDELNMLIAVLTVEQTLFSANETLLKFAGVTLDDIEGMAFNELPWWQHSEDLQNQVVFSIGEAFIRQEPVRFSATHEDKEGELHEIDFIIKPIVEENEVKYFLAMGYNISELVKTQQALTEREKEIEAFFKNSNDGYFFYMLPAPAIVSDELNCDNIKAILKAQRLTSYNDNMLSMSGFEKLDESNIFDAIGVKHYESCHIWHRLMNSGALTIDTSVIQNTSGKRVFLSVRLIAIYSDEGEFKGNFGIVQDVTKQHLYEKELSFLANKDTLTGMNNRRSFFRIVESIRNEQTPDEACVVTMMDIDHFKNVNDTYGHDVGDIVIRFVADAIQSLEKEDMDVSARYGGEEFIFVSKRHPDEVMQMLEELRLSIGNSNISFGDGNLKVTISLGMAMCSTEDEEIERTISNADKALYEAKNNGRNQLVVYYDELHGRRSIDKLTGLFTKRSIYYKLELMYNDLAKRDKFFTLIKIKLDAHIVKEYAILDQFIIQTASYLRSNTHKNDSIGRISDMEFLILLKDIDENKGKAIVERLDGGLLSLTRKFDDLILTTTSMITVKDINTHLHEVLEWAGDIKLTED